MESSSRISITAAQARVLAQLHYHGSVRAREARILATLERLGLVQRDLLPPHAYRVTADGRAQLGIHDAE